MNTDPATKPWSFLFFLQCYNLKCHSFHSFNVSSAPGTQSPRSLVKRQYTWKHAALHHIFSLCLSIQHKHFSRWGRQGWGWVELGVTFAPSLWYSLLFFFFFLQNWVLAPLFGNETAASAPLLNRLCIPWHILDTQCAVTRQTHRDIGIEMCRGQMVLIKTNVSWSSRISFW